MSHPIPPGISDITVYLMATSFVWIGASVDKLPEVEDLDGAEIGSRDAPVTFARREKCER